MPGMEDNGFVCVTFKYSYSDIPLNPYEGVDGIEVLERYRVFLSGKYRKHNTVHNHYHNTKRFLEFVGFRVNRESVQQWKVWANNHYKKINTLNSNINSINNYLQFVKRSDLMMRTLPPGDSNEYSLSEDEYKRLLIASRNDTVDALVLQLLWHLIRPDEINQIKICNRDKDILYLDDTKTGNNHIIMDSVLQELWDKYLLIRPIPEEGNQEYLFINNEYRWRGQHYKKTLWIRNRISRLGYLAGIDKRVKPYTIKRTSITLRLDRNSQYFTGDPDLVRKMARHKKLSTTMKYNRKTDDDIRNYHRLLNNIEPSKELSLSDDKKYRLHIHDDFPEDLYNRKCEKDNNSFSFSFSFDLLGVFGGDFFGRSESSCLSLLPSAC